MIITEKPFLTSVKIIISGYSSQGICNKSKHRLKRFIRMKCHCEAKEIITGVKSKLADSRKSFQNVGG